MTAFHRIVRVISITMESVDVYSMLMLGLLGTGHCLGMCGPLVFAFPAQTGKFTAHIYYHLGRILTYTLVGVIMGAFGRGVARVAIQSGGDPLQWVAGIQICFSLLAAAFLFFFGIARLGLMGEPQWMSMASPHKIPGYRRLVQSIRIAKQAKANFPLGLLLGLLPCGLSFAAFARALAAGGPLQGGFLVLAFGCGTLPGLLIFGAGAYGLVRRYRKHSDILSGILMIGMAIVMATDALAVMG